MSLKIRSVWVLAVILVSVISEAQVSAFNKERLNRFKRDGEEQTSPPGPTGEQGTVTATEVAAHTDHGSSEATGEHAGTQAEQGAVSEPPPPVVAAHVEEGGGDPNEKGADWRGPTTTTTTPEPTEAPKESAEQSPIDSATQTEPVTSEQGETEYKPLGPRGDRVQQIDDVLKGAGESAQQELIKQMSEAKAVDGAPSEQASSYDGAKDGAPDPSTELPGSEPTHAA